MEKQVIIPLGEYENLVNSDKIKQSEVNNIISEYEKIVQHLAKSKIFIAEKPTREMFEALKSMNHVCWNQIVFMTKESYDNTDSYILELIKKNNSIFDSLEKENETLSVLLSKKEVEFEDKYKRAITRTRNHYINASFYRYISITISIFSIAELIYILYRH